MCKNSGAETFRAIIESGRQRRRIIIAAEANFMTQYFVSVSRKSFLHSLGPNATFAVASSHVRSWGKSGNNQAINEHWHRRPPPKPTARGPSLLSRLGGRWPGRQDSGWDGGHTVYGLSIL